jgi:hypothetical protein
MLQGLHDALSFGLIEALLGRRSRRVFLGAEIPDGVFAYTSQQAPVPLTELEKLLVVGACGASTITDDVNRRAVPGIERFRHIVNVENVWPLTFVEQWSLAELTAELATS